MTDIYEKLRTDAYKSKLPYGKWKTEAGQAWRADEARLFEEFKADALAEVGLTGHPKAEAVWSLAWDYGHSSGYGEVMNYLPELAALVK